MPTIAVPVIAPSLPRIGTCASTALPEGVSTKPVHDRSSV